MNGDQKTKKKKTEGGRSSFVWEEEERRVKGWEGPTTERPQNNGLETTDLFCSFYSTKEHHKHGRK